MLDVFQYLEIVFQYPINENHPPIPVDHFQW